MVMYFNLFCVGNFRSGRIVAHSNFEIAGRKNASQKQTQHQSYGTRNRKIVKNYYTQTSQLSKAHKISKSLTYLFPSRFFRLAE